MLHAAVLAAFVLSVPPLDGPQRCVFQAPATKAASVVPPGSAELSGPGSEFRQNLSRFDPRRTYFRFFVWSDSFDVYAAARAKADEAGFAAGWVPFDALQPFRQDLIESRHQALID